MAAIIPKEINSNSATYQFTEEIPSKIIKKNTKIRKYVLIGWGIVIPFLIIAAVVLALLYAITIVKLNSVENSDHDHELSVCKKKFGRPPLVVISLDGFRNSYLNEDITPTIHRLLNYGTHSKYMLPPFPSKTFPSHYAMATGLYPAWNGVVDNRFYDTEFQSFFLKSTNQSGWYLGEPIWETAQKAGLKSAVFFWPGSEGSGKQPNHWMKYNGSVPYTHRIETLINWLNLPDVERPAIIQVYLEEPDYSGHLAGPHSQEVRSAMIYMDGILNYLINSLIQEGLLGCINLILLSDHGMQQMKSENFVVLEKYLGPQFEDIFFPDVIARIQINRTVHPSQEDADNTIDQIISNLECQHENNYVVYRKNHVPIRFHYAGPRTGDIIIKGNPGVCIFRTDEQKKSYKLHGDHGFDNRIKSMRAIFIAIGPDIALNREIDEFQNIELYNLFAHLLKIDAAPNNGTHGTLFNVLRNPPAYPVTATHHPFDQCTNTNIKHCNSSNECPQMDQIYQNCRGRVQSSISVNYNFTSELCNLQMCDAIIHFDVKLRKTVIVEGIIRDTAWMENIKDDCITYIDNMEFIDPCETSTNQKYTSISLFGNLDRYYTLNLAQVNVPKGFADGIWQYVLNRIGDSLVKYHNLRFFSGVAYNQNGDGVRDSDDLIRKSDPSHLFFVLMWCKNSTLIDHTYCKDIAFAPYILPLKKTNFNCLDFSEYLYDNMVRMRDIELLTGIEFFTDRNIWTDAEAIQLRTLLPEKSLL